MEWFTGIVLVALFAIVALIRAAGRFVVWREQQQLQQMYRRTANIRKKPLQRMSEEQHELRVIRA